MSGVGLSVVLDGLILLLLGITVLIAGRLSVQLKAFRQSRSELETLIAELSLCIESADRSIEGLRSSARESGRDLQGQINEASALSDELQIMTEAGDSLASRLENVAEKSFRTSESNRKPAGYASDRPQGKIQGGDFAIHDPEPGFEDEQWEEQAQDLDDIPSFLKDADSKQDEEEIFQSRAERELSEALTAGGSRHKVSAGGV